MDLSFQNFEAVNSTNEQSNAFVGGSIGDKKNLVGDGSSTRNSNVFDNADGQSTTSTRKANFFSFEYYQQFFDVETDQVVKRLMNSVVPTHRNYIQDFVQPIPDLWGPFWVSVTLVFAIGVFGNLAQFIENDGAKGAYGSDFRMVTSASTMIFLYVVFVPLIIYGLLWNRRSEMMHPYVDLVCLYGYSISIFIPVSLLWIIDLNWFRWALILVSVGLSGTVLARAIWPAVQNDSNKMIAYGTIFGIVLLHFLLAFSFKEFFFDSMHPVSPSAAVEIPEIPKEAPLPVGNITAPEQRVPEAPAQIAKPAITSIPPVETVKSTKSSDTDAEKAKKTIKRDSKENLKGDRDEARTSRDAAATVTTKKAEEAVAAKVAKKDEKDSKEVVTEKKEGEKVDDKKVLQVKKEVSNLTVEKVAASEKEVKLPQTPTASKVVTAAATTETKKKDAIVNNTTTVAVAKSE